LAFSIKGWGRTQLRLVNEPDLISGWIEANTIPDSQKKERLQKGNGDCHEESLIIK
jgi:hypothetical protein